MTSQSPDVGCVMELQARYTQYRHTIFLTGTRNSAALTSQHRRFSLISCCETLCFVSFLVPAEHSFEKFPVYSSRGVIMAGIEEIRRDFTRLVGYRDTVNVQPDADILASKGQYKRKLQTEL